MMGLIQRTNVLLLVVGLLLGVAAVLRPFTTAILFGATLAIAAWPLRQMMIGWGFRRGWAGALLLCLAIVVVALPVLVMAPALVDQLAYGMQRVQSYFATAPEQPRWIANLPLFGSRLGGIWNIMVRAEGNLSVALAPYAVSVRQMLITAAQALADSVVQVVLSLIVATMFWARGDTLASSCRTFSRVSAAKRPCKSCRPRPAQCAASPMA
jgi:predicted PurR-regulated permease PerM